MRLKLNKNQLSKSISNNPRVVKIIREQVKDLVEEYVEKNKQQMINEFENHPVTKEIEAGPEASNISNTLGGEGNLFSYIGFNDGSNPTEIIKDILANDVRVDNKPTITATGKDLKISFPISGPTLNEIESVTPMPFEGGRSWVRGIEKGISGFSYYIFKKYLKGSRSGTGLQTESEIRPGSFKPTSYMSTILKKFYSKVNAKFNV
jgi:hypothetical protein